MSGGAIDAAWRFGQFELRPDARLLLRDGVPLKVGGRSLDLLQALIERRERVVSKAELLELVWPRLVVEENNLQVQVLALRRLLGPQTISTVPGRGYRFTAAMDEPPEQVRGPDSPMRAPAAVAAAGNLLELIGRATDLTALAAEAASYRLVTLLGAGGVGKSSLARHVVALLAPKFGDGTAWVDLSAVSDPAAIIDAIAAATRAALPRGERTAGLASALAPLALLLVLDNAEHLIDEVALVAKALHERARRLHLLVTSQAPLRLRVERLYRLEPLGLADPAGGLAEARASAAVQLFVERVRGSDRHFVLDPLNVGAVIALTRRLDGLPLAIEMAAARVPALTPTQLDAALGERFRLLTTGDRTGPMRQHTLQAALQWAHDLLKPVEQTVFRRLAVFVGGFALDAAQQVCSDAAIDAWQVVDALAVLVDRSLVALMAGDSPRYRLLDTPHAFARDRLTASGEEQDLQRRHLDACLAFLDTAYEEYLWARRPLAVLRAEATREAENGWVAFGFALVHAPDLAVALAPGLAQALVYRHPQRFAVWHRTRSLFHDALPSGVRARWQLGWARFWSGMSVDRSRQPARAAAALFRADGHAAGEYRALAIVASITPGETSDDAAPALQRLRAIEVPGWPQELRALRLAAELTQHLAAGRFDDALAAGEAAALGSTADGEGRLALDVGMVYVELAAGRPEAAIRRGQEALDRLPGYRKQFASSGIEALQIAAWMQQGETEPARTLAPALWEAASRFDFQGPACDLFAQLAALEGRMRSAAMLLGRSASAYAQTSVQRLPVYRAAGDKAAQLARQALGDALFERLLARGAVLTDESVPALALEAADTPDADA